jgi:hypothetical protein
VILKKLGKERWSLYLPPFFISLYLTLLTLGYSKLLPDWLFETDVQYQELTAFFLLVLFSAINYVPFLRTTILLPIAIIIPNYFCVKAEAKLVKDQETKELLDEDE